MATRVHDLDDTAELLAGDFDGLLRSSALAGAQVRAVAEAQREGVLTALHELRPRSLVVVVGSDATAATAADLVAAVLGPLLDLPIVLTPRLPGWVGALDVVTVAGGDPGDAALADAAARAGRRGAEVVVAAPLEGPLRDAAAGAADLSPRVPVDARFRFTGVVAVLLAVISALEQVRLTGGLPELAELAERLDESAALGHPERDTFSNEAKSLAARLADRPAVWTGDTPAALLVARHAADIVFRLTRRISLAVDLLDAAAVFTDPALNAPAAAVDPLFHDPEIDGPAPVPPPRLLAVTTPTRHWAAGQRLRAVGDTEFITGGVGPEEPVTPESRDPAAESGSDLEFYLMTVLRVEMAAVYLRLLGDR